MALKLHVVLAKTDQGSGPFKAIFNDYLKFFKDEQGKFKGIRKTYTPRPGTADVPGMRESKQVVTTVDEKLRWLTDSASEHINNMLTVAATNASGKAKSALVVDTINFGLLSSLELLEMKNFLEKGDLLQMYSHIPVRSDADIWNAGKDDQYKGREVLESDLKKGIQTTTDKESYILHDPNLETLKSSGVSYMPKVAEKTTVREIGDYTLQSFTGEYSTRQKAEILQRRTKLLSAITEALKIANEAETVDSALKGDAFLNYLHYGKQG
jgi:hypothetical protein